MEHDSTTQKKPSALALKIATRIRLNTAGDARDDRERGHGDHAADASTRIDRDAAYVDAQIAPLVEALELLTPTVGPHPCDLETPIEGATVRTADGETCYVHGKFYEKAREALARVKGGQS